MRYYSKTEAIAREITEPLGEHAEQHDLDAIADEVLTVGDPWYEVTATEDEFWDAVARHAIN